MVTDITLLGATGYTGGLTADYLGATLPSSASWAVAGRSRAKLEAVADRIEAAGGVRPSVWGHTVDICMRGVRLVTGTDVSRDVELSVFMEVGGGNPPIIAGLEPVWTERRGEQWVHGMLLRGMSEDDDARIRALCAPVR